MSIDKVSITLYDLLGYLAPGYIVLLAASVAEATYSGGAVLALSSMAKRPVVFALVAYFLGHVAHSLGSLLKERCREWFTDQHRRLKAPILAAVRRRLVETFGIVLETGKELDTLDCYQLASAYIVTGGVSTERDTLMAREGFFKTSMIGFWMLAMTLVACAFSGHTRLQLEPGKYQAMGLAATGVMCALSATLGLLFRDRFLFFSRLKNNSTLLLFLAAKGRESAQGSASPATSAPGASVVAQSPEVVIEGPTGDGATDAPQADAPGASSTTM